MRLWTAVDFFIALFLASGSQGYASTTARLPSYPLAVKNPWLSAWVPGNSLLSNAPAATAQFWTGFNLTWQVLARVDGRTYTLFGFPKSLTNSTPATTESVAYSSTHTYVNLSAGGVNFTLDFFSPVYPKAEDYALQALPYSYLTVSASTTSSGGHKNIQILSALDSSWTAQNGAAHLSLTYADGIGYFQFYNPNEIPYTESGSADPNSGNMATWGKLIYGSTIDSTDTSYSCNSPDAVHSAFTGNAKITNSTGGCSAIDLAAITKDLSHAYHSGQNSASATFAIGFEREKTIQYLGAEHTSYHRTKWPTVAEAVTFVLKNYNSFLSDSLAFDDLVRSKTESVSNQFGVQYADIAEASIRQSFGSMELTVPANDLSAKPWAFLKEISSDGNMNTVDLIFQSWPIFVNLNPEWIILQFLPTLEYIASGRWPQKYAIHDIGARYPNATGHDNGGGESMPLFETSALLILVYTYQKFTGDTTYTDKYSSLWPGWAEYLANNGLYPASQLISVDAIPATANQTALAMQSAIGLKAASRLTGNQTYATIANSWAKKIYNEALGLDGATLEESTHFTYNYDRPDSWNVIFTAFSDVLLNLTTFPQSAWDLQSKWYLSQIQESGLAFAGPKSDRGITWGLTDWNIMTASVMSEEVQNAVVDTTHSFLTNGKNSIPFGTKYTVEGADAGLWIGNKARGTVGTHFAISALQQGVWTY